jgi:hypothetical protein
MKFIVEFHLKPENKNKVVEIFERCGPNRNPGVSFRNAWIGTRSNVVFVFGEGDDEERVEAVCRSWSEHGNYRIHPVIDIEDY